MKLLYATDGFEPAERARLLLERIADRGRVEVTVLSITHTGIPAPEHIPLLLDPLSSRRTDTLAIVDAEVEILLATDFKAKGQVVEGHPGQAIVQAIETDRHDLVVIGTGQRTWLSSRLLGSVSTHVLHSSPCSVLAVHDAAAEKGKARILLGTDGSGGAHFTVETLAQFVDPDRAELTVLSVMTPSSPMPLPGPGGAYVIPEAYERTEELDKMMYERAVGDAEDAAIQLRDAGFTVEARTAEGNATERLLSEAEAGRFDLVAVGSRGLGPLSRTLLGSVSDHVVRHARAALVGRRLIT